MAQRRANRSRFRYYPEQTGPSARGSRDRFLEVGVHDVLEPEELDDLLPDVLVGQVLVVGRPAGALEIRANLDQGIASRALGDQVTEVILGQRFLLPEVQNRLRQVFRSRRRAKVGVGEQR